MIDWRRGGWTGSVNALVRREVREHLKDNAAARRARYGVAYRLFRSVFSLGTFGRFCLLYLLIDIVVTGAELLSTWLAPSILPTWTLSGPSPLADVKTTILDVSGYFLAAQVGVLSVLSLAIALVALVAQREQSATDVQIYYHESMAFELVASSVALVVVLCVQLLWPLQFMVHRLGFGTNLQVFKLALLVVHLLWLTFNLGALAHFTATTFRFVQQSAREQMRERYTANVVQPHDMVERLRRSVYGRASGELRGVNPARKWTDDCSPRVAFGFDFENPHEVEISTSFKRLSGLYDVRMLWVRWVIRRWAKRCEVGQIKDGKHIPTLRSAAPQLWFTPRIDNAMRGEVAWCCRRGGAPLTRLERFVLRRAFRFRSVPDKA